MRLVVELIWLVAHADKETTAREAILMTELPSLSIPAPFTDDPVIQLLCGAHAATLEEAEEMYLDNSLAEVSHLLQQGLSDNELARHPLMVMLRTHGSRGWEDSLV